MRTDSVEIGVCDRDRSQVENRPLSRNSKSTLRILAQQQRHLRDAQFFLATFTPRSIIAYGARTKQHFLHKIAARHDQWFRARGRLALRTHRMRDRRARRRCVGRGDDDGVGAAHQRALTRSVLVRRSTMSLFASMARDYLRFVATRRHTAARFGTRSSRETAFIFPIYFLAR